MQPGEPESDPQNPHEKHTPGIPAESDPPEKHTPLILTLGGGNKRTPGVHWLISLANR